MSPPQESLKFQDFMKELDDVLLTSKDDRENERLISDNLNEDPDIIDQQKYNYHKEFERQKS